MAQEQHWIKAFAEKEKQRRSRIVAFKKELPKFYDIVLAALAADINRYRQDFPGEEISLNPNGTDQIDIANRAENARCHVEIYPKTQSLTYQFSGTRTGSDGTITLEMSTLGIHQSNASPELTAREISKAVLKPVMFPVPFPVP
jgi:hypothetical protein